MGMTARRRATTTEIAVMGMGIGMMMMMTMIRVGGLQDGGMAGKKVGRKAVAICLQAWRRRTRIAESGGTIVMMTTE